MIRALRTSGMDRVASIWLETNLQAHSFIPAEYWKSNLEYVREALPLAEVHVYEDAQGVQGFIGLNGDHVEGLFVAAGMQSHGIGKQLMDHVKRRRDALTLEADRKNVDAMRFYQREGFTLQNEDLDESTGEMEYSMQWRRR